MTQEKTYDLLCIGNYTKDTIITPAGTSYVDGGAVRYAAHAAAGLGLRVAVVTHLAQEDDRVVAKFSQAGIDCLATYTPHSTQMLLEYPSADPDIRTLSVAATAGSITAEEVGDVRAKAAVIGPSLRGEVGLDVIERLGMNQIPVAVDVQGYVRVLQGESLAYQPWEEMARYLSRVDTLKSDAVEAAYLTGESDIYRAAQAFSDLGPAEIVLTHKAGLLVYAGGKFYERGFFPKNLNGRSGRGDTCLGSYMSMRLSKSPAEASTWAAAVTSLKMESQGPFNRGLAEVEELIREKYLGLES